MQLITETSLNVNGITYYDVEYKRIHSKNTMKWEDIYRYYIEGYTVYLSHFDDHPDLWSINVIKGERTINQYIDDNIDKRYAGSWAIRTSLLDEEVTRLVSDHLRYSDICKWADTNFPDIMKEVFND